MKKEIDSFIKYQVAWYNRNNHDDCGIEEKELSWDKCEALCNNFNITTPDYYHWPYEVKQNK